ncbi:glycosyltransferase [Longilinea arvoryzae]|uniref:dolichyl-phosphate beta-glucosyltransferase n=1 Tax=Longilinea arvoryzae TaxID=360412 RepID=A0A0S7BEB1_9CHLR|nr:dolichyl-phosphate beta-glucosyltransferase [Longilinea arvoryzae]GAP12360.1 glycosyltransferase [Longilinea arvoryzae]
MTDSPYLSIIIPAHNEEQRLPKTLEQVADFINQQTYPGEIVVVENGSSDRTLATAQEYARRIPYLRVLSVEQRGKGLAVKTGMLAARGTYRFFADADLSMPISEVNRFIPPALPGSEVAIGSREAPGAVRYGEPQYRHLTGRVFNAIVRLLALPGLGDSQCGFKCFRGDIADEIFPLQTMTGWSFDVEVLFIARRRGYQIVEVGIPWYFNPGSKIRVMHDSLRMFLDLWNIRSNARAGRYNHSAHSG